MPTSFTTYFDIENRFLFCKVSSQLGSAFLPTTMPLACKLRPWQSLWFLDPPRKNPRVLGNFNEDLKDPLPIPSTILSNKSTLSKVSCFWLIIFPLLGCLKTSVTKKIPEKKTQRCFILTTLKYPYHSKNLVPLYFISPNVPGAHQKTPMTHTKKTPPDTPPPISVLVTSGAEDEASSISRVAYHKGLNLSSLVVKLDHFPRYSRGGNKTYIFETNHRY